MKKEIADIILGADTRDWKPIQVDFGDELLDIKVPENCEILTMPSMPCLVDSGEAIAQALNQPIGSATISEIIQSKDKPADALSVCITVSDITGRHPIKGKTDCCCPCWV